MGDGYEFEPKPFPTNHDDPESWVWYYRNDNHKDTLTSLGQLHNQCKGEPDSNSTKRPILQRLHRDMHYDQHLEPGKQRSLCDQFEKAGTSLQHRLRCNKFSNLDGTPSHQQTHAQSPNRPGESHSPAILTDFPTTLLKKSNPREPSQEVSLQLIVLLTIWQRWLAAISPVGGNWTKKAPTFRTVAPAWIIAKILLKNVQCGI